MGSLNTAAGRLGRGDSAMLSRPTRGSVSSHDPPSSSSMLTITVAGGAVITQPRRPGSVVSDGASEGRGGGAGAVVKPLDDLTVAPVSWDWGTCSSKRCRLGYRGFPYRTWLLQGRHASLPLRGCRDVMCPLPAVEGAATVWVWVFCNVEKYVCFMLFFMFRDPHIVGPGVRKVDACVCVCACWYCRVLVSPRVVVLDRKPGPGRFVGTI